MQRARDLRQALDRDRSATALVMLQRLLCDACLMTVIFASTTPVTAALQRETHTIPIVFVIVSDPIGARFVASLPRPGGNITGFINIEAEMGGPSILPFHQPYSPAPTR
jgi:ABC-type uncharacterized transport system substrate-binding protein